MEREETEGKAGVHARQSGAKKAGPASGGLAVEQLDELRRTPGEQNPDGFDSRRQERVKTRTLKTEGCGTPPKQVKTKCTDSAALITATPAKIRIHSIREDRESQNPHPQNRRVRHPPRKKSKPTTRIPPSSLRHSPSHKLLIFHGGIRDWPAWS